MITVTVNLDLPAELRWVEVVAPYKDQIAALIPEAFGMIPPELMPYLEVLLGDLDRYLGEPWKSELEGVAAACDLDIGDVVAMNLYYELSAFCTSIVAQHSNGTIFHGFAPHDSHPH